MKISTDARTLYTIGHSSRPLAELIEALRAVGVARLIDIRSFPRSRTNPQFNADVLEQALRGAGITYVHLAALGGRRAKSKCTVEGANAGWQQQPFHNYADYAETAPFREGLRELLATALRETCAIMCAEAVWWRCHRRIVTDHVLAHGVPVVHLVGPGHGERASLTPFAIVGANSRVSYPPPCAVRVHGAQIATSAGMVRSAFRIGDHVSWNSEAGRVRGVIKKKLVAPTRLKGYTVRASEKEPQYVIVGDKTGHVAVHKGSALRRIRSRAPATRA
jgi:Protein of unknown function, DUF488/Hypervirulence associated proteins TUDOR domain